MEHQGGNMTPERDANLAAIKRAARVDGRFVSAAVETSVDDTTPQLVGRARRLAAADAELSSCAGVPFVAFTDRRMKIGLTASGSGLVTADHTTPGQPAAYVRAAESREARLGTPLVFEDITPTRRELADASVTFETMPRHVVSTSNLGEAALAGRMYLDEGVLLVGSKAIRAFFAAATSTQPGSSEERLARQALDALVSVGWEVPVSRTTA
jgi:hypothetical protein